MSAKTKTSGIPDTNDGESTEVATQEQSGAEVARGNRQEVGPNMSEFKFSFKDIDIPILNLIQGNSQIPGENGTIVMSREYEVVPKEGKVDVIVVAAPAGWQEDVPYENDYKARHTYDPAIAEGWKNGGSNWPVIDFAVLYLLFPEPEEPKDPDAYQFPIGGVNYALGRLHVDKKAHRLTYQALATWTQFNKPEGESPTEGVRLFSNLWKMHITTESNGRKTYHAPNLSATRTPSPEAVQKFLPKMLGETK